MNLLDENIREDQRVLLREWRIPFRQIGKEISRSGIQDPDILPLLHSLQRPTFFTHDGRFFSRRFIHRGYCLVWLVAYDGDAALFIRRFLRHREFRTRAQRMGKVVRVHSGGLKALQAGRPGVSTLHWSD